MSYICFSIVLFSSTSWELVLHMKGKMLYSVYYAILVDRSIVFAFASGRSGQSWFWQKLRNCTLSVVYASWCWTLLSVVLAFIIYGYYWNFLFQSSSLLSVIFMLSLYAWSCRLAMKLLRTLLMVVAWMVNGALTSIHLMTCLITIM